MPAETEPAPAVDAIAAPNSNPARIHLYRPQNQLGDLLLTVPAIRSIRERFPRAHIVLVVGRQNADAVLGQPWADEIRVVDTRNFLGVMRAGWRDLARAAARRGGGPDLAVYFTTVSYSRSSALLVRWSGARERIGFDPARYGERDAAGLTRVAAPPGQGARGGRVATPMLGPNPGPEAAPIHQSEWSLLLARAAGAGVRPEPPYYIPDRALLARSPEGAVYLHPGAGKPHNRWPADRFAEVARELTERGRSVWWLEGPQDPGTVDQAARALGFSLPVVRGETIPMLAARFQRASLYVGNDTGPLHLAGAVGCPAVGIYGWTDPAEWRPVGRCVRSVRAMDHKLESISSRDVLNVALPLLEEDRCAVV
ncbi:MAG: glycosyltransferase family 9 protein [Candidatus Latescibacteria bacterium]|nr:glycosyltransferase family 9 protein [Candidatus Latescibacterota bacterium]